MYSARYGDLTRIAAWTDGDCHLCLDPVDLSLYGPTGLHGPETATVDHLRPQSRNGGDALFNLRLAHGGCNSARGTRAVRVVRRDLAGTTTAPRSAAEKTALAASAGALAALACGYAFAQHGPHGERPFNGRAALVAGLLAFGLTRYAT
jgi:5-methylcytosine-specific restriction endonuclease McrA